MKITVSDSAHNYVKEEMGMAAGQGINFTSKVYGKTQIHDGLSVAIHVEKPSDKVLTATEKEGITYFINQEDEWFFANHDFSVDFDEEAENFVYTFIER